MQAGARVEVVCGGGQAIADDILRDLAARGEAGLARPEGVAAADYVQ